MTRRLTAAIIIAILLTSLAGIIVHAQDNPIEATVDRNEITTDDRLRLQVTINASDTNIPQPALPVLNGFNVVGTGTSSQMSIINNVVSAKMVYTYTLQPIETGTLTIDPVTISLGGQTYSTDPITVEVTQGTGAPSSGSGSRPPVDVSPNVRGNRFFVEGVVDNDAPYVGQQVTYSFRLYQSVDFFGQPSYDAPDFAGFWNNRQPDQNESYADIDGTTYRITELDTILFPTAAGEVTIEPARLVIPGGFFDPDINLESDPVTLNVKPLPDGAPDDFSGAVGQFTISASTDTTQGTVNEPLTLHITLEGTGNIENLPDPTLPQIPNWRAFDSTATTNTDLNGEMLGGSKVYEQILVPTSDGEVTIPAVSYTYFNPESGTYETTSSEPITVTIAPAADGSTSTAQSSISAGTTGQPIEAVTTDIRYIKAVPASLETAADPLTNHPAYWGLWGVPVMMMLGYGGWVWRRRHLYQNSASVRSSQARRKANKALSHAKHSNANPYSTSGEVLLTYLSEKVQQPVQGLTQTALASLLKEHGIDKGTVNQVADHLLELEMGRFGSNGNGHHDNKSVFTDTEKLIGELDKEFSK